MGLTRNQKIGAGVAAGTLALILLGLGVYFGFIKKDTPKPTTTNPPTPTRCANADTCNRKMKEWVDLYLAFNDTATNWPECANCPSRWFGTRGVSLDGQNWTWVDQTKGYNKIKL